MITGLLVVIVWSYLTLRDWRVGVAFLGASLWAMANLVVWSLLIIASTTKDYAGKAFKVPLLILFKILVLVGGPVSLVFLRPTTRGQIYAILAGISAVIVVTGLKAVGAWLTGTDIFEGRTAKLPLFLRRSRPESK
jgi:hypothetical protein